ncbi:probable serine carboxypeptidase CPVL [Trichonephila clavipes]|nr:probable serine carboxypeptidase CPVL [Trichonephila clavipes]
MIAHLRLVNLATLLLGVLPSPDLGTSTNGCMRCKIPGHFSTLDLVSERLISPRIPFTQIRRLRHVLGEFGILREANPQVYVETPFYPEKLTVLCALWAGGITGPYFFKNDEGHKVTVNGDRYRAMITNFFIPELNNHDVQELWFQQDGVTCHTARATIDLLKDTFGDRLISRFGPNGDKKAPVLLWLQGGPGVSGLFGFFVENGPYTLDANMTATIRDYHWAKNFQIIFVDNPVGTGFSFTDHPKGYVTNEEEMADDMYEFLQQFFTVFYEYRNNEFYITGESYAVVPNYDPKSSGSGLHGIPYVLKDSSGQNCGRSYPVFKFCRCVKTQLDYLIKLVILLKMLRYYQSNKFKNGHEDLQEFLDFHKQELTNNELIGMHYPEQDFEEESLKPIQSQD